MVVRRVITAWSTYRAREVITGKSNALEWMQQDPLRTSWTMKCILQSDLCIGSWLSYDTTTGNAYEIVDPIKHHPDSTRPKKPSFSTLNIPSSKVPSTNPHAISYRYSFVALPFPGCSNKTSCILSKTFPIIPCVQSQIIRRDFQVPNHHRPSRPPRVCDGRSGQ